MIDIAKTTHTILDTVCQLMEADGITLPGKRARFVIPGATAFDGPQITCAFQSIQPGQPGVPGTSYQYTAFQMFYADYRIDLIRNVAEMPAQALAPAPSLQAKDLAVVAADSQSMLRAIQTAIGQALWVEGDFGIPVGLTAISLIGPSGGVIGISAAIQIGLI